MAASSRVTAASHIASGLRALAFSIVVIAAVVGTALAWPEPAGSASGSASAKVQAPVVALAGQGR